MAYMRIDALLETSLLMRLLRLVLAIWEHSFIGRALAAVGHFAGRVFAGSFIGRVWRSEWPESRHVLASPTGRAVVVLNGAVTRLGNRVQPFLVGTWETSLLGRLARWCWRLLQPYFAGSFLVGAFTGFARDVELAPAEADRRLTSPVVYLLGVLIGLVPLIPSQFSGILSPTVIMVAGVWAVAAFWLVYKVFAGDFRWRASTAAVPVLFLLVILAASTVQSVLLSASLLSFVIWTTSILLFWMIVTEVRNSRDAAVLLGPVLAGGVLMAFWAMYQYKFPPVIEESWVDPTEGNLVRVFAGMANPNYLAEYMTLFIPPAIGLWLQTPRRWFSLGGAIALMGLALLLTLSRGGWLALAIALAIFVVMRFRRWVPLFLMGGAGLMLVVPPTILNRLLTAFNPAHTSNQYRVNIWRGVTAMLKKFWMTGTGLGAEAFAPAYSEFMLPAARAAHAHNTYLQVLAEMGIFGLIAVFWMLLVIIRRPFVVGSDSRRSFIIAAVPAALIGLLFHGLVEHIWYNPKLLFSFWAVAGLGMGLALGEREDAAA